MPIFSFPIERNRIQLEVGISELSAGSDGPPAITWAPAKIDTGASATAIPQTVIGTVGLEAVSRTTARTANGTVQTDIVEGDLYLKYTEAGQERIQIFPQRRLCSLADGGNPRPALIGMDLLSLGLLVVYGRLNTADFSI